MGALGVCVTVALALYVLWFDAVLRTIFLVLLAGYYAVSYHLRSDATKSRDSVWHRMRLAMWCDPYSPEVNGSERVLLAKTLELCRNQSLATGKKITLTHAVLKCLAIVMNNTPEIRGKIAFGSYRSDPMARVTICIPIDNGNSMKVVTFEDLHLKSLAAIADELTSASKSEGYSPLPRGILQLPSALLSFLLELCSLASNQLGLRLSFLQPQFIGNVLFTNYNDISAEWLWAPFPSPFRLSIAVTCSKIRKEAVVVDGKITVQETVNLCAQVDHRFADGIRAAAAAIQIKDILESPEEYLV